MNETPGIYVEDQPSAELAALNAALRKRLNDRQNKIYRLRYALHACGVSWEAIEEIEKSGPRHMGDKIMSADVSMDDLYERLTEVIASRPVGRPISLVRFQKNHMVGLSTANELFERARAEGLIRRAKFKEGAWVRAESES